MFTNHRYLIYMNKPDLVLNNLQWLICHKTKPIIKFFSIENRKPCKIYWRICETYGEDYFSLTNVYKQAKHSVEKKQVDTKRGMRFGVAGTFEISIISSKSDILFISLIFEEKTVTIGRANKRCMAGWVLWHISFCRLFNTKSIFMQIVLFQTIQFSMSKQFNCQKHFYFKLFSLFKQF